jgi:hypothetical protein
VLDKINNASRSASFEAKKISEKEHLTGCGSSAAALILTSFKSIGPDSA